MKDDEDFEREGFTEEIRQLEALAEERGREVERLRTEVKEWKEHSTTSARDAAMYEERAEQAEARLAQRDEEWCLAIDPLNVTTTLGVEMRKGGPSWVASYLREREQLQRDEDRANEARLREVVALHREDVGNRCIECGYSWPCKTALAAAQSEEKKKLVGARLWKAVPAQPEEPITEVHEETTITYRRQPATHVCSECSTCGEPHLHVVAAAQPEEEKV